VPLSFVVYTAIPDRWIPLAENAAAAICAQTGGSYDWEFYDAERVRYVFTSLKAGDAFRAHCALTFAFCLELRQLVNLSHIFIPTRVLEAHTVRSPDFG
jgi:hypothetical protein